MRATIRRWYGEPALVEAVFEMRPQHPGDAAPPRLSDDARSTLRSRLRGFSEGHQQLETHAPVSRYSVADGQNETDNDTFRTCTWNEERNRAVQFDAGICAFNVLAPYGHYEDHLPSLNRVIQTYLDVNEVEVRSSCSQRYLNIFRLQPFERPDELFSFYPPLPTALMEKHVAVRLQVEAVEFRNGVCDVRLWRHEATDEEVTYRMEVISRSNTPVASEVDAILEWHQIAHDAVNRAFDMSITPTCRKRLREL